MSLASLFTSFGCNCASLAEHALRPSEERAHGAGLLLAESVAGVSNGLHSKAALLLPLLLREDVLERSELKPATEVCMCSFPGSLHDAVQGCGYGC